MAAKPKRPPGRKAPVAGDAWADRFYYPMPTVDWSSDDSVIETESPKSYLVAAWESLAPWAQEYALAEQARKKGGKPPVCPDCEQDVITYPFRATESYEGVWCSPCHHARNRREAHAQAG